MKEPDGATKYLKKSYNKRSIENESGWHPAGDSVRVVAEGRPGVSEGENTAKCRCFEVTDIKRQLYTKRVFSFSTVLARSFLCAGGGDAAAKTLRKPGVVMC